MLFGVLACGLGYVAPAAGVASGPLASARPASAVIAADELPTGNFAGPIARPISHRVLHRTPTGSVEQVTVDDGVQLDVTRLTREVRQLQIPLPFQTRKVQDSTLPVGTSLVQSEGRAGIRTVTAEYVIQDGVATIERVLSERVTPAQDRVIRVGTRAAVPEAGFAYTQAITGTATSYCLTGRTAMGTNAGPGSIAVDPTVIKLGSHLYVTGYGYGWAVDTGSAIKGTLVDVWYTCEQAIQWGRRPVTIYVLPA